MQPKLGPFVFHILQKYPSLGCLGLVALLADVNGWLEPHLDASLGHKFAPSVEGSQLSTASSIPYAYNMPLEHPYPFALIRNYGNFGLPTSIGLLACLYIMW